MEHAVIYLRQMKGESTEKLLSSADIYITKLKNNYIIKDVICDYYNDRSQLDNFINSTPKDIDVFITDHLIKDKFDQALPNEVSRIENFRIEYIKRSCN